jgi:hypothetical protein
VRAKPGMARRAEANAESVAARLFSRREKSEPKNQNGATRGRRAHDVRAVAALFTGREARATRVLRRDRETMGNTIANALNLPATMTRMMMFEGANLDEAMTAQAFANIEAAVGIPGIADHYQRALERYHFKQRKDAAGGMRPEDYLTMGSTYLWRNAEYNKDLGVGLQVAETVGGIVLNTVGNIIPGVGTGIWLAYNALKQSYMGSLKGGTRGALAGYFSAGLTAFTSQFGVNAGVSYSYEDGWGGQVGVTLPIGDTSLSGSAGINFQEGEGITGTSVGLSNNFGGGSSNNPNTGYQGGIGLSFDQYGDFAGGNLNFGYGAQTQGGDNWYNPDVFNVGGSLNFDRESFTGIGLNASGTNLNHLPGGLTLAHTLGAGLTFNFDGSAGFSISQSLGYNNATGFGINGLDATNSGSFWWDEDGEFQGVTNSITLGADWQSKEDAHRRALQERERVNRLLDAEQDPVKRAELGKAWNDLNDEIKGLDPDRRVNGWNEKLEAKVAAGDISQERADEIRAEIAANPSTMDGDSLAKEVWGTTGDLGSDTSRGNWFTQAVGVVGDGLRYALGMQSDEHGFVDSEGNYHERTCFVAGTWVRVREDVPGAFQSEGRWFKLIEDVRVGDWVLSFDLNSNRSRYSKVTQKFVRADNSILSLEFEDGTVVHTTNPHRFFVYELKDWVDAQDLRPNQSILTEAGEGLKIRSISISNMDRQVYNFSVDIDQNYFVSRSSLLVHNDYGNLGIHFAEEGFDGESYFAIWKAILTDPKVHQAFIDLVNPLMACPEELNVKCGALDVNLVGKVQKASKVARLLKNAGDASLMAKARRSADVVRNAPGMAQGGAKLKMIDGQWLRGTAGNAGNFPGQVADRLRGQSFKNFDDFRNAFWKEVARDQNLASQFSKANVQRMLKGSAPKVPKSQSLGQRGSYELHHVKPLNGGGGVYDLDNLIIVTPRYHKEILSPSVHYGP